MAPRREHATAVVLTTLVKSHDAGSILVEPGHFTPARWFLEYGLQREEAEDQRPYKKRKIEPQQQHQPRSGASTVWPDSSQSPLLFEATIDFVFSGDLQLAQDEGPLPAAELPVVIIGAEQEGGHASIRVAALKSRSPVLTIEYTNVSDDLSVSIRAHIFGPQVMHGKRLNSGGAPATIITWTLAQTTVLGGKALRLKARINWRSGVSAFPSGSPRGAVKIYEDYERLVAAFPDRARDPNEHIRPWSPRDFYDSVHATKANPGEDIGFEGILESSLYPFQSRAVTWLLRREGVYWQSGRLQEITDEQRDAQAVSLITQVSDLDGQTCYVDHLRGVVSRDRPDDTLCQVSGGLLAEEMGLGKTVELMTLISLHRRPEGPTLEVVDEFGHTVQQSRATLIITPPSILQQWASELARHAPALRVLHYEGVPGGDKYAEKASKLQHDLATNYDVVLATYSTLAKEINFAQDPPKRDMRHARRFERKRSPLVQLQWWRICLDEAQMLESGVTNAAKVACRLPRVHSWAVSGTPLRKDVQDLCGLLIFLRFRPFSEDPSLWNHLIANHRHLFRSIFSKIALRHTKAQIRDELVLPPQKRVVVTVPFSVVEHQNYSELFDAMCQDVGVTSEGAPLHGDWDPTDPETLESMRSWLIRLRQTCLHPQVGDKNRKALGRGSGPLRTVAEVLEIMIEQNESSLRLEEKATIELLLRKGHILGNNKEDQHRSEKALELYKAAMASSAITVKEARERLLRAEGEMAVKIKLESEAGKAHEALQQDHSTQVGPFRNGLRAALQLQHTCIFFAATSIFQIKTNAELTPAESALFQQLDTQESSLYDNAKEIRQEIMKDCAAKVDSLVSTIQSTTWTAMPKADGLPDLGGIESRRIVEKSDAFFKLARALTQLIETWRSKMAEYLTKPLVDKDGEAELTGEEYETSTKEQDELYAYFDAFKIIQADLTTLVTGESTALIDHESKTMVVQAKKFLDPEVPEAQKPSVHAPHLTLELFSLRNKIRAQIAQASSLRGLISETRQLEASYYGSSGSSRAGEGAILLRLLSILQDMFSAWSKVLAGLERELALFRNTQNQRVEFYRQLQEISDDVAPYKEELDETLDLIALDQVNRKEEYSRQALAQLRTKNRLLTHLRDESGSQVTSKLCVICQSSFERGVLTVCGHQYCKECIQHWFTQSRTCPMCKRKLTKFDIHDIIFKPQELRAQEEKPTIPMMDVSGTSAHGHSGHSSIYCEVDADVMDSIKSIDLPTSYGTKIDTLGRHLLHIREKDAGAKSIVFSQYREFLDVLSTALTQFRIRHTRHGRPHAAEKFKDDPSIDCLLLDAKTDSSGLTLVAATHVFICEPLVQTAVELQAIARVHRIGQTRPTTVWMYLVSDTVEESIYELSVSRRLAHAQSRVKSDQSDEQRDQKASDADALDGVNENAIDAANSEELTAAPLTKLLVGGKKGGERVDNDDLWQCLFGNRKGKRSAETNPELQLEVARHLRGEAAERRRAEDTWNV